MTRKYKLRSLYFINSVQNVSSFIVVVCTKHIRRILLESVFPKFRINEYFQVHVDDTLHKLTSAILGMFHLLTFAILGMFHQVLHEFICQSKLL